MSKKPLLGKRRVKEIAVQLEEWRGKQADKQGKEGWKAFTDELQKAAAELGIDSKEMLHFCYVIHPDWPPHE